MSRPDFGEALNNLIPEYREKFSLPEIHQLGLVVADVEEAARHLEEQGLAPFFIATGSPAFWLEREKKRFFRGKLGFSHHHGVELELLEPGEGSDFSRRSLAPEGRIVRARSFILTLDYSITTFCQIERSDHSPLLRPVKL